MLDGGKVCLLGNGHLISMLGNALVTQDRGYVVLMMLVEIASSMHVVCLC